MPPPDDTCPRCSGSFEATGGKPAFGPYQCQKCSVEDCCAAEEAKEQALQVEIALGGLPKAVSDLLREIGGMDPENDGGNGRDYCKFCGELYYGYYPSQSSKPPGIHHSEDCAWRRARKFAGLPDIPISN